MNTKQTRIKPLLFTVFFAFTSFSLPRLALADSFPFSAAPIVAKQSIGVSKSTLSAKDIDAVEFPFLQGVALTAVQRSVVSQILNKQMPAISLNIDTIEHARILLRDMALTKTYDETIANIAADNIANGTAKLAVLQVEREYQVLALLTPEQIVELRKKTKI